MLHLSTLPVSFGLLAFVFAGHAVFPAIYTSMAQPEEYEGMLNKTYAIVGLTCLLIGGAGKFISIKSCRIFTCPELYTLFIEQRVSKVLESRDSFIII